MGPCFCETVICRSLIYAFVFLNANNHLLRIISQCAGISPSHSTPLSRIATDGSSPLVTGVADEGTALFLQPRNQFALLGDERVDGGGFRGRGRVAMARCSLFEAIGIGKLATCSQLTRGIFVPYA